MTILEIFAACSNSRTSLSAPKYFFPQKASLKLEGEMPTTSENAAVETPASANKFFIRINVVLNMLTPPPTIVVESANTRYAPKLGCLKIFLGKPAKGF